MSNTLTVTAKTGPAKQATSLAIPNVTKVNYDFLRQVAVVFTSDRSESQEYDLTGVTTLTISLSDTTYTLVLS